ncbi:hypothetical protein KKG45_03420 [bacterium]|nr:hypothetical protein [bacterium]MBU1072276.1 hypothetical protein [bacterium]MBU1675949.1 hypothetical protein [bacterium]
MFSTRNITLIVVALIALFALAAQAQQHGEYGDAPEGVLAYPASGIIGSFPTCVTVGPAAWIYHAPNPLMFFGPMKDFEPDGNAGTCPMFAPYDMDECFMDPDAGMIIPGAFTIVGGVVVPCGPPVAPLGLFCTPGVWGGNMDIMLTNGGHDAFVNVLMDWNQDGIWAPSAQTFCSAPEHILVDFPIPPGYVGPLSGLAPPPFLIGGDPGYVWSRFSITERPVGTPNWNGAGQFEDGESEDYLVLVDGPVTDEDESWSAIKQMYR